MQQTPNPDIIKHLKLVLMPASRVSCSHSMRSFLLSEKEVSFRVAKSYNRKQTTLFKAGPEGEAHFNVLWYLLVTLNNGDILTNGPFMSLSQP